MGAATIVTLVAVAVIVGAVAIYLITIAFTLLNVSRTLERILGQVHGVVDASRPLSGVVPEILGSVEAADDALREAVAQVPVRRRTRARAG